MRTTTLLVTASMLLVATPSLADSAFPSRDPNPVPGRVYTGNAAEASLGKGGKRFVHGGTPAAAFVRFHASRAERGDLKSIHKLADCYASGYGVGRDLRKAASLYREAADRGYRWSQLKYGAMLADGRGVTKDAGAARAYLEKAQSTRNSWASYRLAKIVRPTDPARADRLLRESAERGNESAQRILGFWKDK